MRYHVLACDYDGTLAHHGRVDDPTVAALERVRASGRKLILVTGRQLEDLQANFSRLDLFELAVLENGGIIYDPRTSEVQLLGEPPPPDFADVLRARGVDPVSVGRVVVATWQPHETTAVEVIKDLGLELQVVFNKGAVMILPSGVNKASGLLVALEQLGYSRHNVVGVGDAENDHAFLHICECAVTVSNALPKLKDRADLVTVGRSSEGVTELTATLVNSDLRALGPRLQRHALRVGTYADGGPVTVGPYSAPVLVAGTSGGGKTTVAITLLEQLVENGYQFCVVDPEGDYGDFKGAVTLGDRDQVPGVAEILELLSRPSENVIINLLGVSLANRPPFFQELLPRLLEMRARTGRPHFMLVDETHHLLPQRWDTTALSLPGEPHGFILISARPGHVSPALLRKVGCAIVVGPELEPTLSEFAAAVGLRAPQLEGGPSGPGLGVLWSCHPDEPARRMRANRPHAEHRRHVRKYAIGELGPDASFFFRGPDARLRLRAQNLHLFVQIAEGVDDDTWLYHLHQGDYSRWMRESIKDGDLAEEVSRIEAERDMNPAESRARVHGAISRRYTAPA